MTPKYAIQWGVVWRKESSEIKGLPQRMWCRNRLLWHTNSDFYGIRAPPFYAIWTVLLGVGVVFSLLTVDPRRPAAVIRSWLCNSGCWSACARLGSNLQSLRASKQKVDPDLWFQVLQFGVWIVSGSRFDPRSQRLMLFHLILGGRSESLLSLVDFLASKKNI